MIEMDADFSHDPVYLESIVQAADEADVVLGSRYLNGISVNGWPLRRILLSLFANWYVQKITRLQSPGLHEWVSALPAARAWKGLI